MTVFRRPLLDVDQLNKIDGITFVTSMGLTHKRITGYVLSAEGPSGAPMLSLETSREAEAVVISTLQSKAWLARGKTTYAIQTDDATRDDRRLLGESRRLGSCLTSGACLFDKADLVQLRRALRSAPSSSSNEDEDEPAKTQPVAPVANLGSAFGGGDGAIVGTEDLLATLRAQNAPTVRLEASVDDEAGHPMELKIEWSDAFKALYFENVTDGTSILQNRNATFYFSAEGDLTWCDLNHRSWQETFDGFEPLERDVPVEFRLAALDFDSERSSSSTEEGEDAFIPVGLPDVECVAAPVLDLLTLLAAAGSTAPRSGRPGSRTPSRRSATRPWSGKCVGRRTRSTLTSV